MFSVLDIRRIRAGSARFSVATPASPSSLRLPVELFRFLCSAVSPLENLRLRWGNTSSGLALGAKLGLNLVFMPGNRRVGTVALDWEGLITCVTDSDGLSLDFSTAAGI